MTWAKSISERAIELVLAYERQNGRHPERYDKRGVGYDINSKNEIEERFIEVKGISESWTTYTWQPLHRTEVECLRANPDKFYLYILYFDGLKKIRNDAGIASIVPDLYIIGGRELLHHFAIREATYSLSPISRSRLAQYKMER